ncbi:uncharacterized protein LOC112345274 [Selaginella moellendorffii]|uniref:uncharacterized protein LOC112345274 n=1 Tax=Selaginella moellendorffii TaxID=88036 RepID=UPI000D1C3AB8|nr:uncharacterized protein LOC112345274 [Selaginella moellendorffii]XP_024527399.1 uncharacterized protein LOC112345274 [Selaginella moellendorffii]XP_024527400.1 uncharacterized protein LOC112345274 [Selaginella moellendorffii]|eukprot:XP_024527397.1 uncharacterized protein LOC112345274 [Selaginella moellendorffii]
MTLKALYMKQRVLVVVVNSVLIYAQQSSIYPSALLHSSGSNFVATLTFKVGRSNQFQSRDFTLDTSAQLPVSKCASTSETFNISFTGLSGGSIPTSLELPVRISCRSQKNAPSILALGSSTSSFPFQATSAAKLPLTFAYCLGAMQDGGRGQLSFGRRSYFLFNNSDVLQSRPVSFIRTPLFVTNNPRSGSTTYLLRLQRVQFGSVPVKAQEFIQIGTTARFTSLPNAAYDLVRQQVVREAARKKIRREPATFKPLSLCYRMSPTQLGSFPSVVMDFGKNALWTITPGNYMIPTGKNTGVVCFGFLKTGAAQAVIGTLQQENYYVEYNEKRKMFGFTEPLIVKHGLGCAQTSGS